MKSPSLAPALLFLLLPGLAAAETLYITNQLNVGLHEERTPDSPIIKLVPSGTALEIVKKEDALSFVRDPDGVTGWVDNSYLGVTAAGAGSAGTGELERQLAEANQRAQDLETRLAAAAPPGASESQQVQALRAQLAGVDQQLKEERLRSGELQVQAAELRKHVGMDSGNASLYQQIDKLEADRKTLEVQLAAYQQGTPQPAPVAGPAATGATGSPLVKLGLGRLAAYIAIFLLVGFGAGMYFLDYLGRRRHGGFRI